MICEFIESMFFNSVVLVFNNFILCKLIMIVRDDILVEVFLFKVLVVNILRVYMWRGYDFCMLIFCIYLL